MTKSSRAPELEAWRRTTSMTLDLEPYMDDRERRAGLKRLMKWIEEAVSEQKTALQIENCKFQNANLNASENDDALPSPRVRFAHVGPLPGGEGNGGVADMPAFGLNESAPDIAEEDDRAARKAVGLGADWEFDADEWARVRATGVSLEALCERLGMSRGRLSRLCREYCNLSAQEVIDGYKLRGLKKILTARLKEAAFALWGKPGYFAAFKTEGFLDCEGRRVECSDGKVPKEFYTEFCGSNSERMWAERVRRIRELVARIARGFDWESFAARMGYLSAWRLKRACLTVFGRRIESIERIFAAEVVDYYLCAEDRELRHLALREPTNEAVYRAREMYHGAEEAPRAPFLDRWSAAEQLNGKWVMRMGVEFG